MNGRGVLILGPSGSGKSALALQLIAFGAILVSDDRTEITRSDDRLTASVPPSIAGLIEARGVGILWAEHAGPVPLGLIVDLGQPEAGRLPQRHEHTLLGLTLPCLHNPANMHFAAAIHVYMRGSRKEPA